MEGDDNVFVPQVTIGSTPKIGQQFETPEDVHKFYNEYARAAGFGTRIENSKKKKGTEDVVWKLFVCSRAGKTDETYQMRIKNSMLRTGERNRGHTKCGCPARLSIVKQQTGNSWAISHFVEHHNHAFSTPSKVHLLRSHRKVSTTKKALVQQFAEANIPTCQQVRLMEIDAGGPSSMGCKEKDIRNHQRDIRQERIGHDAQTLIEHFTFEQERNPNFFYTYETDEDGVFARCFWADCDSRCSYAYFGDVVVFDTTYNTNKYSMVFAPFVGVNHHRQTIVFGCGLLSNEKTESFVWLFSKFLEAMTGQSAPRVIITDQDAAISRAVSEVFPTTLHRYCLWHILNKFSEKMGVVLYRDQYHRLVNIIRQSESTGEFESRWAEVMETTVLGDNEWLRSMYEIRSKWVPAYVKHVFAAGMSSSQRSESNHAFYKRYVDKKNSLLDFITRFNRALVKQRHLELVANHIDLSERPRMITSSMMENQMASVYTKTIFLLFQKELEKSNFYICSRRSSSEVLKLYVVQRYDPGNTYDRHRELTYFVDSDLISCSCQMFDFDGYPCRHMLSFWKKKQMMTLPEKYIVKRWTQTAKMTPVYEFNAGTSHGQPLMSRHGILAYHASELVDEAALTDARSNFLLDEFRSLKRRIKEIDDGGYVNMSRNRSKSPDKTPIIADPKPIRTKGSGKRLKSGKEKMMSQPIRNCSECGRRGHDKRTCPTLKSSHLLVDEPYHPQFSFDDLHNSRYTSLDSNNYDGFQGFPDENFP